MPPAERRFPPPWSVAELDACFIVKDNGGQKLAFVYFENEPGRRAARQALDKRRGAEDRAQHSEAAGIAGQAVSGIRKIGSHRVSWLYHPKQQDRRATFRWLPYSDTAARIAVPCSGS